MVKMIYWIMSQKYGNAHPECKSIMLLLEDARRCLQMGFEAIKHHCLNRYQPLLMWLPKTSSIREIFRIFLGSVPQVASGLENSWGLVEYVINHPGEVSSVAFPDDETRVVSGSYDSKVRIWNSETGQIERVLEGHFGSVMSVAFSGDGKRVVSGSQDHSILI